MMSNLPREYILCSVVFFIGLAVGILGTVLYQKHVVNDDSLFPPSCSENWGLEFINDSALEHYADNVTISNVQLKRPLTAGHVRTLSLSRYGNDCYGELIVTYLQTVRKSYEELPPLTQVEDKWVDSQGREYTEWHKFVPKEETLPVTYERFLTDDQNAWIQIKSWTAPEVDFSDLLNF